MKKQSQTPSYFLSIALHVLLLAGMFFYQQYKNSLPQQNYVEIGFGEGGPGGSPGDGSNEFGVVNASEPQPQTAEPGTEEENKDAKVDLTKSTTTKSDDAVIADKRESRGGAGSLPSKGNGKPGRGFGNGEGNGTGYDIDWGGNGQRRIYSYNIPDYPPGVNKELDIRIRFTILPDGTVGRIVVLTKGDTRLENTAVNALRQWRFEPIRSGQPSVEQTVVIVFPFRLR